LEKLEMKKTLVALAALASVSAFAQSSVTLSGYFDRGYTATNNTNDLRDAKTFSSSAGTTTIIISGSEDLGGGLKAGFLVATDWSELGGQSQDGTVPVGGVSGFGNSQSYIDLASATNGTLRLGAPNSEVLVGVTSVASPAFSTGVGSAYSSNFSIHNGYGNGNSGSNNIFANSVIGSGIAAIGTNVGARQIRQGNTIKYISPKFNGIGGTYSKVFKVDSGNTVAQSSTLTNNQASSDVVGVTEWSLNYANGPLSAMYAVTKVSVGQNGSYALANNSTSGGSQLYANSSTSMSILGASYQVLPVLKLHAGVGASTNTNQSAVAATLNTGVATGASLVSGTGTVANTSSYQFGATYDLNSSIVVMAQSAKVDDKSSTNTDRTMLGLGVDYKFSKTSRAYVRYDSINFASNLAASTGTAQKRTAVGISTAF